MLLNTDLHGHVSSTWRCVLPSFPSSVGVFALMQYAFLENQDRVAEGTLNRSRGNCGCWGQSWGQTFSYCHCTLKPKSHLMSVIPYRHRQCSFLPRTYCIHQPCPRSSHGEVLATNLCGVANSSSNCAAFSGGSDMWHSPHLQNCCNGIISFLQDQIWSFIPRTWSKSQLFLFPKTLQKTTGEHHITEASG